MLAVIAHAAGRNVPFDTPSTPRAKMNIGSELPAANSRPPATAEHQSDDEQQLFECPRSA